VAENKTQPDDTAYYHGSVGGIALENIRRLARDLVDEIARSREFTLFKEFRERLNENPQLLSKIKEFKNQSFAFEAKKTQGIETDFEDKRLIGQAYAEVIMTDLGRRYIEAENNMFDMLNKIYETLDTNAFTQMQTEDL